MTQEALKLALEALEYRGSESWRKRQPAITAIKEALAQPEQEPVAWRWETHNGYAYSEQHYEGEDGQPLYTTPPQRTWVGLTTKEFHEAVEGLEDLEDCWVAIEAKLRSKND